ncbi:MAG: aminoglycoside phosphotransferase [Microbacterium sp.]
MARSPLTLAAAVTAAVPGARIAGARRLSAGGEGRFDSAVATLGDGAEVVVRVPSDAEADQELSAQVLALRALTPGVRGLLEPDAPEYLGATTMPEGRAVVTSMVPGYQIDAAQIPPGDGAAVSIGRAFAAIHALPTSVVRAAGLPERTAADARENASRVLDAAAASGHLPVRLTVRWREAIDEDRMWAFESTVGLGGVGASALLFGDDERGAPVVTGVYDWHGLSIDDPAIDLRWLASAPDAEADVVSAYADAAHRAPDGALRTRARFHAEMEFARWLVHGLEAHRDTVVRDAAALLDSLADGVRDFGLLDDLPRDGDADVDDAIALIGSLPEQAEKSESATAIETDAYSPEDLALDPDLRWDDQPDGAQDGDDARDGAASGERADDPHSPSVATEPIDLADLQREMMSSSEDGDSSRSTRSSDT